MVGRLPSEEDVPFGHVSLLTIAMTGLPRRLTVILGVATLVDVVASRLIRQGLTPHVVVEDAKVLDRTPRIVAVCMTVSLWHARLGPSAALLEKRGDWHKSGRSRPETRIVSLDTNH